MEVSFLEISLVIKLVCVLVVCLKGQQLESRHGGLEEKRTIYLYYFPFVVIDSQFLNLDL